ncbi:Fanconi anemia core complex-associated protein 20 isoform X2 [Dicentrarchus labrax]|uniref:Fanconi anemia core complex-associated protein 20 isoform X2 n=1 Tax=Dicentrarchus labrax TaxID=13489 RepID=UPI0021F67657|nr:Fanconi anemia core complex-associated protein 20 isoform X2 [Dicentrarchus labrax]
MAENHSKSKLKRKKSSVEDLQPELSTRGPLNKSSMLSRDLSAEEPGRRSVVAAAVWWNRQQLPAVESLWALTLKAALENQHWDMVPDLPHPSTVRPTALKLDDLRWCDLSEEVLPFPIPSPPPRRTSWSPDPLRLSSYQQDLSVKIKPVPDSPDRRPSFHSKQGHNGKTTSLQALAEKSQPPFHSWEGEASPVGPSGVGGGQQDKETGPVNRQLLTDQVTMSDRRVPLQKKFKNKEEMLKSCPMCLQEYPVGFTQMDCDGHLAQCLSEVNVDVTW